MDPEPFDPLDPVDPAPSQADPAPGPDILINVPPVIGLPGGPGPGPVIPLPGGPHLGPDLPLPGGPLPGPDLPIPGIPWPGGPPPGPDLPIPGGPLPGPGQPWPPGTIIDEWPEPPDGTIIDVWPDRPDGTITDTWPRTPERDGPRAQGGGAGGQFTVSADELVRLAQGVGTLTTPIDGALGRVGSLMSGLDRRGWNAGPADAQWGGVRGAWNGLKGALQGTRDSLLGRATLARILNIFGLGGVLPWLGMSPAPDPPGTQTTPPGPRPPDTEVFPPLRPGPGPDVVYDKPEGDEPQPGQQPEEGEEQPEGQPEEQQKPGSIVDPDGILSPEEQRIADLLRDEGKEVEAVPTEPGKRTPDAKVDGKDTEFKTPKPGATSDTIKNEVNDSIRRGGQGRDIVIDSRGSGLSRDEAERALGRIGGIHRGRLDNVRIVGDGFDVNRNYP